MPLSLATTRGISTAGLLTPRRRSAHCAARTAVLISFPGPTKMFQFGPCPSRRLAARDAVGSPTAGFPIRESPDQRLHPAPRGLSQGATPFIGPWRRGIHREPVVPSSPARAQPPDGDAIRLSRFRGGLRWRWGDSNPRPGPCKGPALPPELHPHHGPAWIRTTDLALIRGAL